jgi:nitroreductase
MEMNITEALKWRYATKRMNGNKIPIEKVEKIKEAIQLAPTSLGLQAFKIIEIENPDIRRQIFEEACQQEPIIESDRIFVFAANLKVTSEMAENYMKLIAQTREIPLSQLEGMLSLVNDWVVKESEEHNFNWAARQTYLVLGIALLAAAAESVDATPIEGFNPEALDKILHLKEQNLGSVTIMALGYRDSEKDKYEKLKKVRKPIEELFVKI